MDKTTTETANFATPKLGAALRHADIRTAAPTTPTSVRADTSEDALVSPHSSVTTTPPQHHRPFYQHQQLPLSPSQYFYQYETSTTPRTSFAMPVAYSTAGMSLFVPPSAPLSSSAVSAMIVPASAVSAPSPSLPKVPKRAKSAKHRENERLRRERLNEGLKQLRALVAPHATSQAFVVEHSVTYIQELQRETAALKTQLANFEAQYQARANASTASHV